MLRIQTKERGLKKNEKVFDLERKLKTLDETTRKVIETGQYSKDLRSLKSLKKNIIKSLLSKNKKGVVNAY